MGETVLVPGGRDVRATLDRPDADDCVVACPPHPQFGGSRSDERLRAVSEALAARPEGAPRAERAASQASREQGDPPIACLRFDYGPWDEGRGELADVRNAIGWARDNYDDVGLFGYSFGGSLALVAADGTGPDGPGLAGVSALAPGGGMADGPDAVTGLDDVACSVQIVYGERDDTVDWEPVVERARELDHAVVAMAADHHFLGQADAVAEHVADFLTDALR